MVSLLASGKLTRPGILALLVLCASLLTSHVYEQSQSSLFRAGRWIASKRMANMALNGADEFLLNRDPIRGTWLNLGSWSGYQKVLLREVFDPITIDFEFELSEGSYVTLIFGESESGFSGVRLSNRSSKPSGIFEAGADGAVTRFTPIETSLPSDTRFKANLGREAHGLVLRVNGHPIQPAVDLAKWKGRVGFWGGLNPAFVGNLKLGLSEGHEYRASFKSPGPLVKEVCLAAILVTLLCLGSAVLAPRPKSRILAACATGLCLNIVLLTWLSFDRLYWSRLPFQAWTHELSGSQPNDPAHRLERGRIRAFNSLAQILGEPTPSHSELKQQGYPVDRIFHGPLFRSGSGPCKLLEADSLARVLNSPKKGPRLIFSGSSQTVGAGGSSLENTFFALVTKALAKRRSGLEALNIAESGAQVVPQYAKYEKLYLQFKPDLVVLNWSTNDPPGALRLGIQSFLETNKRLGIRTLLVAEANSTEGNSPILAKHEVLQEMAKRYQVPLLNSHSLLAEREKTTNDALWWDQAHLTDLGQKWVAKLLEPAVLDLLPR